MPRSLSTRMVCSTSCTTSGARPSEGSSNMMSSGAPIRQRPMASICCSPPDMRAGELRRCARRGAGTCANTSSSVRFASRRARGSMAPISRFSSTLSVGKHLAAFGDLADAEVADAGATRGRLMSSSLKTIVARRAAARCRRWCGSARTCRRRWRRRWRRSRPCGTSSETSVERLRVAVVEIEVLRLGEASVISPSPRRGSTRAPPGRARPPRGVPRAITSPWCRTPMCCASAITARITCSMSRMVVPSVRLRSRNTSTIWSHLGRAQARHHLVEQQQLRPRGERARDLEALAVGQRERGGGQVALRAEAELLEDLGRELARARPRASRAGKRRPSRCRAP